MTANILTYDPITGVSSIPVSDPSLQSGNPVFAKNNILTKMFQERCTITDTLANPATSQHAMVLNCTEFGAIKIGILNANAAIVNNVKCIVAPTAVWGTDSNPGVTVNTNGRDPSGGAGSWIPVTFGGAATATLAAGTAAKPSITWSDWVEINSLPRTDFRQNRPILMVRVMSPGNGVNNPVSEWGTTQPVNLYDQELTAPGGMAYRALNQALDGVTVPGNFTQQNIATQAFWTIAVKYASNIKGRSLMVIGDSTIECATTTPTGLFGFQQLGLYNNPNTEIINSGWTGQNTSQYYSRALTNIALFQPDMVLYAPFSSNDCDKTPAPGITQANINAMKTRMYRVMAACQEAGSQLCLATSLPGNLTGANAINWGATDILRQNFDASIRQMATVNGYKVFDRASVIQNAAADPSGAIQSNPIYNLDGTHINNLGQLALSKILQASLGW